MIKRFHLVLLCFTFFMFLTQRVFSDTLVTEAQINNVINWTLNHDADENWCGAYTYNAFKNATGQEFWSSRADCAYGSGHPGCATSMLKDTKPLTYCSSLSEIPRGALVFYGSAESSKRCDGHVGISDGNGKICDGYYPSSRCRTLTSFTSVWCYDSNNNKVDGRVELKGWTFWKGYTLYSEKRTGTLDVNGLLDGINSGATSASDGTNYGTFDVYINGSRVLDDWGDYCEVLDEGTTYEIKDIKAYDGFSYDGPASYSGTIIAGNTTDVRLKFDSCWLDVNGWLDNQDKGNLGKYGKFSVKINGSTVAENETDFYQRVKNGASYEIYNISANYGYVYDGVHSGSQTGKISAGKKTVSLAFHINTTLMPNWVEADFLPGFVNSSNAEIQYKNHYERVSSTSPGSGWTRVGNNNTWVYDSGWQSTPDPNANSVSYRFRIKLGTAVTIKNSSGTNITGMEIGTNHASTYQLYASVTPSTASQTVSWSSDNTSIAIVSNGKVTFSKYGSVTITARTTDGGNKSAWVKLTYKLPGTCGTNVKYVIDGNTINFSRKDPETAAEWGSDCGTVFKDNPDIKIVNVTEKIRVTDAREMFKGFEYVEEMYLSNLDVSNVTDMSYMFYHCYSLTDLDVSGWNTSNVTDMDGIFGHCSSLTSLDISGWNTSNVTDMDYMFYGCSSLTSLDISGWDTSNVLSVSCLSDLGEIEISIISCIFHGCTSLTTLGLGRNTLNKNIFELMPNYDAQWHYVAAGSAAESPIAFGSSIQGDSLFSSSSYTPKTMAGVWSTDANYPVIQNSMTLPDGVKIIGESAFEGVSAVDEFVLPDGLLAIGSRAFASCGARLIHIPDSVQVISEDAFQNNANLILSCQSKNGTAANYARTHNIAYRIGN